MMLKLIKQPSDIGPFRAIFQNFERADEQIIFDNALDKLRATPGIVMANVRSTPYADFSTGTCEAGTFKLYLDLDYGVDIRAEKNYTLDFVQTVLEA